MLAYIIKSITCLLLLMVFYKIVLEKKHMHIFKRFYLLLAVIVSLTIPLITFTSYIEVVSNTIDLPLINQNNGTPILTNLPNTNWLNIILWSTYSIGAVLFMIKFYINLKALIIKIKTNTKQKDRNFIIVFLEDSIVPHTFLNYIFFNKHNYINKAIPEEVILHEKAHAQQKHTIDILFIEILQIFLWFNPILFFVKKAIKLNHEFLADDAVLSQGKDSSTYQNILLSFTTNAKEPKLAHGINYSSIKKRFTIMKTQTSKEHIWTSSFLLLPFLAILFYSFSSKETVAVPKQMSLNNSIINSSDLLPTINGIECDNCEVNLSQNAIKRLILGTNKDEKVKEFKIKFPGKPTATVIGNKLNRKTIALLKLTKIDGTITIYDVKTKHENLNSNIFIQLVSKNDKNYSNSPIVKKGEVSTIPPPPPPTTTTTSSSFIHENVEIEIHEDEHEHEDGHNHEHEIEHEIEHVHENTTTQFYDYYNNIPEPPKSGLDHIKSMTKKGAKFFFNGTPINENEAIKLIKEHSKINISSQTNNGKSVVHLSTKPITIINGKVVND